MDEFMTQVNVAAWRASCRSSTRPSSTRRSSRRWPSGGRASNAGTSSFRSIVRDSQDHPEYKYVVPTLRAYIRAQRTETYLEIVRNPYFPIVDTAGNQLPYIDRVRIYKVNDVQMAVGKMITGESTYEGRNIIADQIPLFKSNEAKGGYKTLIYADFSGSKVGVNLNLSQKDPDLRKLYLDKRFRIASR